MFVLFDPHGGALQLGDPRDPPGFGALRTARVFGSLADTRATAESLGLRGARAGQLSVSGDGVWLFDSSTATAVLMLSGDRVQILAREISDCVEMARLFQLAHALRSVITLGAIGAIV